MRRRAAMAWVLVLQGAVAGAQAQPAPVAEAVSSAFARGDSLLQRGELDSAVAAFSALTEENPANARAHLRMAQALSARAGRRGKGSNPFQWIRLAPAMRRELETALRLDPTLTEARRDLAWFHRLAPWWLGGRRARAIAHLDTLRRADPYRALLVEAGFARLDERLIASDSLLRAAIRVAPDRAAAYATLGDLLAEQHRTAEAVGMLRRSLALAPVDRPLRLRLASVLVEAGLELPEAEAELRRWMAEPRHPTDPPASRAQLWLARALAKQGQAAAARAQYDSVLAQDGSDDDARKERAALDRGR